MRYKNFVQARYGDAEKHEENVKDRLERLGDKFIQDVWNAAIAKGYTPDIMGLSDQEVTAIAEKGDVPLVLSVSANHKLTNIFNPAAIYEIGDVLPDERWIVGPTLSGVEGVGLSFIEASHADNGALVSGDEAKAHLQKLIDQGVSKPRLPALWEWKELCQSIAGTARNERAKLVWDALYHADRARQADPFVRLGRNCESNPLPQDAADKNPLAYLRCIADKPAGVLFAYLNKLER